NKLAATSGGDMSRRQTVFLFQNANYGSCTFNAQIPVVDQTISFHIGNVIGMAFYFKFDIGLTLQNRSYLTQHFFSALGHVEATTLEQELIGDIYENNALVNFDVNIAVGDITH